MVDLYNEEEWFSECCYAPPMYPINDKLGICIQCRDHATFELIKEEEDE